MKVICTQELKDVSGGNASIGFRVFFALLAILYPPPLGNGTIPPNERKNNGSEQKE